jgi:hypothetical protein
MDNFPSLRRGTSLAVLGLFAGLSLLLTFPLGIQMDRAVLGNLGDPLLIAWTLAWDVHQLFQDPLHLFEANCFYPYPHVLAYSEHLFGDALLVSPLLLVPKLAVLAANVLFLLSFALSGWGVYLLMRELSNDQGPAILAGLIFAFSPYRLGRLGHLHILSTQWIPFIFLFLHRFTRSPNWKYGLLAGLFYILQGLSSNHYAVFLGPVVLLWAAFFLVSQRSFWTWRNVLISATCGALALIFLLPFFMPYLDLRHTLGFTRFVGEAKMFSAQGASYLSTSEFNRLYGVIARPFAASSFPFEKQLFPGLIATVLALTAVLRCPPQRRLLLWSYGAILVFAVLMTFGPRWTTLGKEMDSPYRLFFNYVPGWSGIRVPARMHMITMLALSILAGLGATALRQNMGRMARKVFTCILGALVLLESFSVPLPLVQVPPPAPVYRWLAAQPGKPVILELPMPVKNEDRWKETAYVYASIFHWKPLVNGYSGYFPPSYFSLCEVMQRFPDPSSLEAINKFRVTYVLWHSAQYDSLQKARIITQLASTKELISVVRFGEDWVLTTPINLPAQR